MAVSKAVTGSTNIAESCTGRVVASMDINSTTKDGYGKRQGAVLG